jgi:WD40 repeat protein
MSASDGHDLTGGKRRRQAGRERVDPAEAVPDGRWIVTASQFTVGLWDAATGQLVLYLGRHPRTLTGASFSPSGNWILTGSEDGTARVYDCVICEPLPSLEATAAARLRALR